MLRASLLVCLFIAATSASLFVPDTVNRIDLTFVELNWDAILDSFYARGQEERLVGTALVNGVRYDSVGVRYKGHSSYNPSRAKNPLNVKLDEVIPGQLLEGHGTLRLANIYKDPSCVREALAYEIARKYMPAARAGFANVYVNGTLLGLYTCDEDVDERFMRTHFYCGENARFKGQMTDSAPMAGWKYYGPDTAPYREYFELESDSGWRELVALFDTLNNHPDAIEEILNVDRHLWMLAFDILLVNLDAPVNMPQNHYLYRDASRRFNPIIWDLNESFGAFRDLHGTGQLTLAQMQRLSPFLRDTDPEYPICSRILDRPRYRRQLVAHMKTLLAENIATGWYEARAYELQDVIAADVRSDPNKFYTYNDFQNNVTRTAGSGPLAIVGLTELMRTRASWLASQAEFTAGAPALSELAHSPEAVAPNTDVLFSCRATGADSVWLGWREARGTRFIRTPLYDDGAHGDGAAADGVFANTIRVRGGTLDYYVYAENSNAGVFDPARAEHEFHTLNVTGGLVINELLARNVNGTPDPNGEHEDWIELFNNSTRAILLDAYLLTDDTTEPARWVFPDVAIPAQGYTIIWADDDGNQPGLHANFKLAESGENLLLSDPDGRVLDRVVFGPQTADVSHGRYPNGTGTFMAMLPTPGAPNVFGLEVSEPGPIARAALNLHAWPNPFPGATALYYNLPAPGRVRLQVFDAGGRRCATLVDAAQPAGARRVGFTPRVPAGVYFARLQVQSSAGNTIKSELKLVLVNRND